VVDLEMLENVVLNEESFAIVDYGVVRDLD
jgi:hypothetical protein